MTTAIEELRAAAKKVSEATGNEFVFASVEIKHDGPVTYYVYRSGTHIADTLDEAVEKAISWSPRQEKINKAAKLRAEADALEKEAA